MCTSFGILMINFDWGIPTDERLELLFEEQAELNEITPNILAIKEKINRAKVNRYISKGLLSKDEKLIQTVREFLLVPYAGDEYFVMSAIKNLNPYKFQFDPKYYVYGGGLIYTGAVFLQAASWMGFVHLIPEQTYYMRNPSEIGKLYLVLRFMIVLFAAMGVFIVYCITKNIYGEGIALLSWGIIMAIPVTYEASHTIEPHIFVLPFFALAFYYAYKSITSNIKDIRKNYILSAIFAGFSIGTQASSLYIVFAFFSALIINYKNNRLQRKMLLRYVLVYALISIGACLLINPFYLLNYKGLILDLQYGAGNVETQNPHFWIPSQLTWFLFLLFTTTTIYHTVSRKKDYFGMLSLSCIIPGIFIYITTKTHIPYVYPILPLLAILSVKMFTGICFRIEGKWKYACVVLMVTCFLIFPVARSAYYLRNFTSENRDLAGEWINNNVPKGSIIGVIYPPNSWDCMAFRFFNYKLVDYRKKDFGNVEKLPDIVLTVGQLLPKRLSNKYSVVKVYESKSIIGYRFEIKGELHSLIARTIRIYSLKEEYRT